jgi:hypothetical protein
MLIHNNNVFVKLWNVSKIYNYFVFNVINFIALIVLKIIMNNINVQQLINLYKLLVNKINNWY